MRLIVRGLGFILMWALAFALTFGTARYGVAGTVVGLVGLVPLAALQWIATRDGRTRKPFGGFAGTLGLLTVGALALAAAVSAGVPDLGRLDFALLGAGILSVVWLHAVKLGHVLWGALAVVGVAAGGVAFVAALFQTGWGDPHSAADVWWRTGWGWLPITGVGCAVIGLVVRWASSRSTAVDDLPVPASLVGHH